MNVNKENKYVSSIESTTRPLNKFDQSCGLHTTFDSGKLIPIYLKEVLPNDVRKLSWNSVLRLLTPKFPTMDNAKLDTFFFYVRNRDVFDLFPLVMGENPDPWAIKLETEIPTITIPLGENFRSPGDLADYLGIPMFNNQSTSSGTVEVNALPFRAVCKIWNDYFRDENYQSNLYYPTNSAHVSYQKMTATDSDVTRFVHTGSVCPPINRYKDYFSSCLPAPQKGKAVELPLGDYAPVVDGLTSDPGAQFKLKLLNAPVGSKISPVFTPTSGTDGNYQEPDYIDMSSETVIDANVHSRQYLRADLSAATAASINSIRLAFQSQRFLEQSARGGTRYVELLASMYGVTSPDLMLNRAQFLGGKSFPVSITPVTDVGSNLGNVGGMSNTVSGDYAFKKHFNEHGFIIGFAAVRTDRSYSQGIEPLWFRKSKLDYYFPVFSHIGEQPVLKREIYAGIPSRNDEVFGYREAWNEYRFSFNKCTGYMRSGITDSLNAWTYSDDYKAPPTLNSDWLTSQKELIDRTITNPNKMQFIADFWFNDTLYSVVTKTSAPGLIDHY